MLGERFLIRSLLLICTACSSEVTTKPDVYGSVVAQNRFDTGLSSLSASFRRASGDGCTVVLEAGACRATSCSRAAAQSGEEMSAGRIEMTGGQWNATLSPHLGDGGVYYVFDDRPTPVHAEGDIVSFDVEGSVDVRPFSVRLQAPARRVGTLPSVIDRSEPLTFDWAVFAPGELHVVIERYPEGFISEETASSTSYDYGPVTERVSCSFDGAAGSGTIPREVLAWLTPSELAQQSADDAFIHHGQISITTETAEEVVVDGGHIDLRLESFAADSETGGDLSSRLREVL